MTEGKGSVILRDRCELTVDGIDGVLNFDEAFLTLKSSLGDICVEGEGMKIESLSKEKGEVLIKGTISAIYYKERASKKRGRT